MDLLVRLYNKIGEVNKEQFIERHKADLDKELATLDQVLLSLKNMNKVIDKERFTKEVKRAVSRFLDQFKLSSRYYGWVLKYLYDASTMRPSEHSGDM